MNIPAGATVYIGPPAQPMSREISDALGAALSDVPGILEAHLPMMYCEGKIDPPAQVLVVVLADNASSPQAQIAECIRKALPANVFLDVLEWRGDDPGLPNVRATGCALNLWRKPN